MKKTLIALAVVATAAVSGSATAATWNKGETNTSIQLSGLVDVLLPNNPWVVKVGEPVKGLNAQIKSGEKQVKIGIDKTIPVLGIRTESNTPFKGQSGISPQISFGKAIDIDKFDSDGRTPLTLDVKNEADESIGTLTATFHSGAEASSVYGTTKSKFNLYAAKAGQAFYGGLGQSSANVSKNSWFIAKSFDPDFVANYNDQGATTVSSGNAEYFNQPQISYSAFYGSGLENVGITLNQPARSSITWKASLPVSVTYQ
ncbi:fimbrial protein [Escherichia coli]|uniref:F4 family fimbrial subunit n=1 Tax=Escherichia coli TaxID=562 RepID=UPI0023ED9655|nr:fimbrial protein [Escherichia coli]